MRRRIKKVFSLDADKFKFRYDWRPRVGGNGFGLSDKNVSFTLNKIDQHMVGIIYACEKKKCEQESVR